MSKKTMRENISFKSCHTSNNFVSVSKQTIVNGDKDFKIYMDARLSENLQKIELIKILKANKILLLHDIEYKDYKRMEKKVRNRNVATFYQIASIFKITGLEKFSLSYIERCFPIVFDKENLDFVRIAKIISSSELRIDSEMEVLNAIDNWISYDFVKRSKFASRLLSKVRLNLLPVKALNMILDSDMSLSKIDDCVAKLTNVLKNNQSSVQNMATRYCSQNMFNVLFTGGLSVQTNGLHRNVYVAKQINVKGNDVKYFVPTKKIRTSHISVYCSGAVYVFEGYDENYKLVKSIEKYSLVTKTWEDVGYMPDCRSEFRVTAFMDKIIIVGGIDRQRTKHFIFCLKFDTKDKHISHVAKTNQARIAPSSTVYMGRIFVSGGRCFGNLNYSNFLKTVEAYDPLTDTWSPMPSMIDRRCYHRSTAIRNKLFIIGIRSCEVFDSKSEKFVYLKRNTTSMEINIDAVVNTFSIGNKLVTIFNNSSTALCYDVEKDEWSEEAFSLTKNKYRCSCTLLP